MADLNPAIVEAIKVLNRVNDADPTVLAELTRLRVPCNEAVADDPSVQVHQAEDGTWELGILGLINGIFGVDARGVGYIAAMREEDGSISSFQWNGVDGG